MEFPVLISIDRIKQRISEMAEEICRDFPENIHCIVNLDGALVFFVDLMRELHRKGRTVSFECIKAKSYAGSKSMGKVNLQYHKTNAEAGKVLIVEDIVDTGLTLEVLQGALASKDITIKTCVLIDKKAARQHRAPVDYAGFEMDDSFLIGYGLDYDGKYRDLPFISRMPAQGSKPVLL